MMQESFFISQSQSCTFSCQSTKLGNFSATATMLIFLLSIIFVHVSCSPPEDPIKCTGAAKNTICTITNSIGAFPDRSICHASAAVYPKSEEELILTVAHATAANKKIKVGTRYSHSIPKLACPDGKDGVLLSTNFLNRTIEVNASAMTLTVESGVTLSQLIAIAAKANMALPYAPYWQGLTVGGMMATGAHGSSLFGIGSQVHDYVIKLRIVSPGVAEEGYVKVRDLETGNPELDAAKVSLGVLGVITQVTFQLQPLFKRSLTYFTKDDTNFGEDAVTFGRQNEFADFTWYPSQKLVVYRRDNRVPINTTGDGVYDFIGFRSTATLVVSAIRTTEDLQESLGDAKGKCRSGNLESTSLRALAYGLTSDGILFKGYPVVGYHNRLQSSGSCLNGRENNLLTACPWDPRINGFFFHQTTFSIALPRVKSFIQDLQELVRLQPDALCGLDSYSGILMRYVTVSSAYLGKEEDALDFDLTYYRSKDPLKPRLFEDVLEEIEQMAVFKYEALPHWGKNRNVAFIGAIDKFKNRDKFLNVKKSYDPMGLFSSEWTDEILGLKGGLGNLTTAGCALEGLCICSEDSQCAPAKGYFCRPGRVYKQARVCRKGA